MGLVSLPEMEAHGLSPMLWGGARARRESWMLRLGDSKVTRGVGRPGLDRLHLACFISLEVGLWVPLPPFSEGLNSFSCPSFAAGCQLSGRSW